MATQLIQLGPATTILQNIVYALPASKCRVVTVPNCELAQLVGGPWVAMVGPTEGFDTAASFIRCTTGNAVVTCKKE